MTGWKAQANCRGIDPEAFFPARGDIEGAEAAKAVCAGCVVRAECLEFAIATSERDGIWGGLSGRERRQLKRARATSLDANPKADRARQLRTTGRYTVAEVAEELDVDVRTVKRWTGGLGFDRVTPERGERAWCTHCDADRAATSDGICRPCDEYRRKYRHLPDQGVLIKRWRARDARRHTS